MQKSKNPHWPFRCVRPRQGAEPEFAKALTRDLFGRHYWDDARAAEVRRSLERGKLPKDREPGTAAPEAGAEAPVPKSPSTKKAPLRCAPRPRERRSELASARERLLEQAKKRDGSE